VLPVSDEVLAAMRRVSQRLGLHRAVRVLQSTLAQVPVLVGYFRPVILLPVSLMTSLPVERLEAILAHELAHVRRHDFLVNLVQTLIETLFFYHPAVWWLSRQIRVEREHCCDDLVVASLGSRIEYGRALLAIEELRGASTVLALGAADGSLLSRVRRIVGIAPDHAAVRLSDRWPVAFVTLGFLLAIALGTFVSSRAEMETPLAKDDSNLRAGRESSGAGRESSGAGRESSGAGRESSGAGRGSPDPALDPAAGLSNSDGETNPPNNANGDLRSNPAAGSGDPRRAQSGPGEPHRAPPVGLEFLKPYPKLHGLSLDMTEPQFLEIIKQQELKTRKTVNGQKVAHHFALGDDHTLIVMFDKDSKCSGIQRVRGEDNSGGPPELRSLRKPALLLPDHWFVQAVGFDNEGKELVTASNQSFITIRRWDVVGMKLISEIKLQADKHGRAVRDGTLMFSGDRRRVIAATDAYVGIWETATGKLLTKLPIPKIEMNDTVRILTCTPDFSVIVGDLTTNYSRTTEVYDAHTVLWDGNSGKMLRTLTHKGQNQFFGMSLSSDGKRLATTNGGARIWDTSTGQQLLYVPNDNTGRKHSDPEVTSQATSNVWSVQFSPSGQQLAFGDILGVKLVDVPSGKLLNQLEGPHRYGLGTLVFSKDGHWLARLGTGDRAEGNKASYVVPIWSTQTGAKLFELHTQANDATFSDDGQRLAVVFSDMQQALSVWKLSGDAANVEQTAGPGPHSRQDRVEENGHYVGKTSAEFIDKFQPTWGDTQLGLQYGIALTNPLPQLRGRDGVPT
jgi:WD40 repeat protein